MDWQTYKVLCEQPRYFSRWALVTTAGLVGEKSLQTALYRMVEARALEKPADHRGNAMTDFFPVSLDHQQTQALLRLLEHHAADRRCHHLRVTWREYHDWLVRQDTDERR
ncbi:MAG: hypothetical protein ACFHX7_19570 [Pseudomonadota bacterium]